jgi:acyl-CoA hydrolase
LLRQGVSGTIKRHAGLKPFRELGRKGVMPLGSAVETGAGRLPYLAIILNSEFVGGHEFSGVGGQRDFMSGAFRSKGGLSFLAFYSTAKGGTLSKIVPRIEGILSETRMEPMWVVTEHGICNLKGKSMSERALALIDLAGPKFRDDLLREAKHLNLVR